MGMKRSPDDKKVNWCVAFCLGRDNEDDNGDYDENNDNETVEDEPISAGSHPGSCCGFIKVEEAGNKLNL